MIWRMIVWWFDTSLFLLIMMLLWVPNYEDTTTQINLNVKIDIVTKCVLCYWNSKDIPTAALVTSPLPVMD